MEHSKSEIFHFTRERGNYNPSIVLPVGPFTEASPLRPQTYWRYLGIFFDRTLTFREHVRFYSTKAFSTVRAMGMLGNSLRGLSPMHKRLLYRSCVVPVATYGMNLWYHGFSKSRGHLESLRKMQRRAALWITGAFRTSPIGGVESLAGLIPIHLHVKKLAACADMRVVTLSPTHPIRTLVPGKGLLEETPLRHRFHVTHFEDEVRDRIKSSVCGIGHQISQFTERFHADSELARPGHRLMDVYGHRIKFYEASRVIKDDELVNRLNRLHFAAEMVPNSVIVGVDGAVPKGNRTQAVAAAIVRKIGQPYYEEAVPFGKATSTDVELRAIVVGLEKAVSYSPSLITLFTDSLSMARLSVDPSHHPGQFDSHLVCVNLSRWLADNPRREVAFVHTRSHLKWGIHHEAHTLAKRASFPFNPEIPPRVTFNFIRRKATEACKDEWQRLFSSADYRGHHFLRLCDSTDKPARPSYVGGGPWLPFFGDHPSFCARAIRCILGHAPMGEFRARFNIAGRRDCEYCGTGANQTRAHLLRQCNMLVRPRRFRMYPYYLGELYQYLGDNTWLFSFNPLPREARRM
ncbi:hypothetical protein AGABI1DRAFT_48228 [Agaricus bisporus var. burnettii JB137-S8]|uniref:RNase H type-1 domain-containing protein n=1 Tax=Agaricus bisporus var. burnettii (strain JB137-S8 / ATCC MYA-4627 / FGSC 10392) TaxID=597362 RepID=K5XIN6_AGABU|nr:uncharacterized protein AGABI1DRAFT_48228 [Agaricus bisporus var. burnettii JB137-S8]EKM74315.1 hypothetical protein AGABI1DRAFT_48228 [Agaricus bisporus var. burnettii JB137-S8]